MAASKNDIAGWIAQAISEGHDFLIVVCDTFDYSDYPVTCSKQDFEKTYTKYSEKNMQTIMEIFDLGLDTAKQLDECRAFHYPPGFKEKHFAPIV